MQTEPLLQGATTRATYAFANHNPIAYVDPDGNDVIEHHRLSIPYRKALTKIRKTPCGERIYRQMDANSRTFYLTHEGIYPYQMRSEEAGLTVGQPAIIGDNHVSFVSVWAEDAPNFDHDGSLVHNLAHELAHTLRYCRGKIGEKTGEDFAELLAHKILDGLDCKEEVEKKCCE